jgi:hypothetical protein
MLSKRLKVGGAFTSALLEILIIIVGILLSLWISNLFQRSQENKQEAEYLLKIEQDLQRDLVQLRDDLQQREMQLQAANTILGALRGSGEVLTATIAENVPKLMFTVRFSPSQATFSTLESTGHLSWIRNDSIVGGLTNLYNNGYSSIHHNNDDVSGFRDDFLLPLIIDNFDFRSVVDRDFRPDNSTAPPLTSLFNHLVYETITLQSTVEMYTKVINQVEALLDLVRRESEQ